MLTLNQGLGFVIWNAYKESQVNDIIEGIICIGAIGLLLDQLLDLTGNILSELVSDGEKSDTLINENYVEVSLGPLLVKDSTS